MNGVLVMNNQKFLINLCVLGSFSCLAGMSSSQNRETLVEVNQIIRCDKTQPVTVSTRVEIHPTEEGVESITLESNDPDFNVESLIEDAEIRINAEQNGSTASISKVEDTQQYRVITLKTGVDNYDLSSTSLIESENGELRVVLGKKQQVSDKK